MGKETIYVCDSCIKTHKEPEVGRVYIDTIRVQAQNDYGHWCTKEYIDLCFCNKECLKAWIDKEL